MEELEGAICLFVSVMIINQVISFKVYLVDFIYILFLHILLVRNNFSAKEKRGVGGSHVPSVPPLNPPLVMIILLGIDVSKFAFIIKSICLLKCLITFRDVFDLI